MSGNPKKDRRIGVNFTEAQYKELEKESLRTGVAIATLVRAAALKESSNNKDKAD